MAITELSVFPHGTRVKVKRGQLPTNPALVEKLGTVVEHSVYSPHKVEVTLDGETSLRAFAPAELSVVSGPEAMPRDRAAAKARLARP